MIKVLMECEGLRGEIDEFVDDEKIEDPEDVTGVFKAYFKDGERAVVATERVEKVVKEVGRRLFIFHSLALTGPW